MATWQDGNFEINMMSSEVVITRHHISRFLHRSPLLKIKPNTCQTPGTTDKIEKKIWLSLRGQILNVTLKYFSKYEKAHNGGQTWNIFFLSEIRRKSHYLLRLSVKLKMFISVLGKLKLRLLPGDH